MAVTSIWPVKSRVEHVIEYARNPQKTTEASRELTASLHQIDGVLEYAADEMKTEMREYVTGVNCSEEYAAQQFKDTKLHFGKMDGRLCYHGYQSFQEGEVDASTAHTIGVELAKRLCGDRFEVLVATHCNTGHYHNHFVINSVSYADGRKFYNSHEDYRRMREESDRLCKEYRLSVIAEPKGRGQNYSLWQAEQNGKLTLPGMVRSDIDRAIIANTTDKGFWKFLREMGYELHLYKKDGRLRDEPSVRAPGAKKNTRFSTLGEGYSLDDITQRLLQNVRKQNPFPEAEQRPTKRYRYRGNLKKAPKLTGLSALYIRYCYELHIIVKRPASFSRVSFLLREDVLRLDKFIAETRFLGKTGISAIGELTAYRDGKKGRIADLTKERGELRNRLKRAYRQNDGKAVESIKTEVAQISAELKGLRKEVVYCDSIEQRSGQVQTNLGLLIQEKQIQGKEKSDDEHIRRNSGSGRAYDAKRR